MSYREVMDIVPAFYTWVCNQCNEQNEEDHTPITDDLTCQACGANYTFGKVVEHGKAKA
jgi:hypothetical protein